MKLATKPVSLKLCVSALHPIVKKKRYAISSSNTLRTNNRVNINHALPFAYDDSVPELIGQRCTELERGARMVDAMITNTMLPEIGREFLLRLATGSEINKVHLSVKDGNFAFAFD